MRVPSAYSKQDEIEAAIRDVEASLAPDVVRIRYEITHDWSREWAIFFKIVLTDDAAKHRLREAIHNVREGLDRHLDFPVLGVWASQNFRTVSEQAMLLESAWA